MSLLSATLVLDFQTYWHCGTGRGGGVAIDAGVARDQHLLPMVPGRTIKGVLRDAVRQYEALGHAQQTTGWTEALFGSWGFEPAGAANATPTPRYATIPGRLQISSAFMDHDIRNWLQQLAAGGVVQPAGGLAFDPATLIATLFHGLASTAIDEEGTARTASLRNIEVAVPLRMEAEITLAPKNAGHQSLDDGSDVDGLWLQVLREAAPLIGGIGAGRTRGLGRCHVSLATQGGGA